MLLLLCYSPSQASYTWKWFLQNQLSTNSADHILKNTEAKLCLFALVLWEAAKISKLLAFECIVSTTNSIPAGSGSLTCGLVLNTVHTSLNHQHLCCIFRGCYVRAENYW